jgi:WD40 repeat protein
LTDDGQFCVQGEIRVWEALSYKFLGRLQTKLAAPVLSVEFSPDGNLLAAGSCQKTQQDNLPCKQGVIQLWDLATHRLVEPSLLGHSDTVLSVAFSSDGKTLASSSSDRTILLWDVPTHLQLGQPLVGHTAAVYKVAYSPHRKILASASADNTVRLWNADVSIDMLQRRACQIAGRNLTATEWKQYMRDWKGYMSNEPWHPTCPQGTEDGSLDVQQVTQNR